MVGWALVYSFPQLHLNLFCLLSIDDLRRKFQSYQVRYQHKMQTDVDVYGLIGTFDGQLHEALENLASAAKSARLFKDSTTSGEETPMSTPNSSSADDSGKFPWHQRLCGCVSLTNVTLSLMSLSPNRHVRGDAESH